MSNTPFMSNTPLTILRVPKPSVNLTAEPKIAVVILTKDNTHLLLACLKTLLQENYRNYDIIIGDTGSSDKSKKEVNKFIDDYHNTLDNEHSTTIKYFDIGKYHFSKNNNKVVEQMVDDRYELILLLNNDIEFIPNNNTLSQVVQYYNDNKETIGTIGIQLLFGGTKEVQHQGIFPVYDKNTNAMMVGHTNYKSYKYDYETKEVFGNTGAFLMISRELWNDIGGLNENYESVFQDVELNVQTLIRGKKNVLINSAIAYHKESSTRSKDKIKNDKMLHEDLKNTLSPFLLQNAGIVSKYFVKPNLLKKAVKLWSTGIKYIYENKVQQAQGVI